MHSFLFIRFKSPQGIQRILQRLPSQLLECLSFIPEQLEVRRINDRDIFISAQASDYWKTGGYHTTNEITTFDGLPFHRGQILSKDDSWAKRLRQLLIENGIEKLYREMQGQFSVLHCANREVLAFGDSSGSRPLFYIETPDLTAISNRQSLLSPICTYDGYRSINIEVGAWATSQLHVFGVDSIYKGVKLLPPGRIAMIDANGSFSTRLLEAQIWTHSQEKRQPTALEYDEATEDLLASYRGISQLADRIPGQISLSLTGGKDSRLGLALCCSAGLQNRIKLFTYGTPENPEVQVAKFLCESLDLEHTAIGSDPSKELNVQTSWTRLRNSAYRFDFSHGGVDGGYLPTRNPTMEVELTGSFSDIFRRIWRHSRNMVFASSADAYRAWENWPVTHDALGVVLPHVRARQFKQMRSWIDEKLSLGLDLNDLPEVYYVENRMTWWAGGINTTNLGRIRLVPLSSLTSSRIGLMPDVYERAREHLHFNTLKRLSGRLLSIPFLNDTWHTDLAKLHPEIATAPFKIDTKPSSNIPPWYSHFIKAGSEEIRSYLLDSPNSGLFEIIDHAKVANLLSNPSRCSGEIEARQILNLILVQMALTRDYSAPKDDVRSRGYTFATNIEGLDISLTPSSYIAKFDEIEHIGSLGSVPATSPTPAIKPTHSSPKLYQAPLPKSSIKRLRIDPSNAPGLIKIDYIRIRSGGETFYTFPLHEGKPNGHLRPLDAGFGFLRSTSIGDDPQIIFDAELDLSQLKSPKIEILAFVEHGAYLDIHWDKGRGFSAAERSRIPL